MLNVGSIILSLQSRGKTVGTDDLISTSTATNSNTGIIAFYLDVAEGAQNVDFLVRYNNPGSCGVFDGVSGLSSLSRDTSDCSTGGIHA